MASDTTKREQQTSGIIGDVTFNLKSLQFENSLSEEEKNFMVLLQRSYAITVTSCAQASYFVSLLNEARQVMVQLRSPHKNKMSKLIQEGLVRDPLHVGVIGCGRLGGHLVKTLMTFGEVQPDEIQISCRRPDALASFADTGVRCVYNNGEVTEFAHILFLCVLPSQLPAIAEEVKSHLSPSTLVYSFASSIPASKVAQLLSHKNVVRPLFEWDDSHQADNKEWEAKNIPVILGDPNSLVKTCPLQVDSQERMLHTDEKFAEALVYGFINMCTSVGMTATEVAKVVNGIILGETASKPLETSFAPEDISRVILQDKTFPMFDLTQVIARETPITKKMLRDKSIRKNFVSKYLDVFQSYILWNAQNSQKD